MIVKSRVSEDLLRLLREYCWLRILSSKLIQRVCSSGALLCYLISNVLLKNCLDTTLGIRASSLSQHRNSKYWVWKIRLEDRLLSDFWLIVYFEPFYNFISIRCIVLKLCIIAFVSISWTSLALKRRILLATRGHGEPRRYVNVKWASSWRGLLNRIFGNY